MHAVQSVGRCLPARRRDWAGTSPPAEEMMGGMGVNEGYTLMTGVQKENRARARGHARTWLGARV